MLLLTDRELSLRELGDDRLKLALGAKAVGLDLLDVLHLAVELLQQDHLAVRVPLACSSLGANFELERLPLLGKLDVLDLSLVLAQVLQASELVEQLPAPLLVSTATTILYHTATTATTAASSFATLAVH